MMTFCSRHGSRSDHATNAWFLPATSWLMRHRISIRVQIELIQRLCGTNPNVTFFLDYNQAIFSFKGAFLDEIQRLADLYPNTRKFYLARNHRSTGRILDSANRLIRSNGSENCSIPMREEGINPLWVRLANEIPRSSTCHRDCR